MSFQLLAEIIRLLDQNETNLDDFGKIVKLLFMEHMKAGDSLMCLLKEI